MPAGFGPFHAICSDPYARARAMAGEGRKVAGYLCTYAPEELIYAAGYLPVRILGYSQSTQRADGLLQSFSCSLARAALEAALSHQVDFIDLMVFPHTCDTVQNLTDIWMRHGPAVNYAPLDTPVGVTGGPAVQFYHKVLARFHELLESHNGPVSTEALWSAIALYARHRAVMNRIYSFRRDHPGAISVRDMGALALSAFFVDRRDHLALIEPVARELEQRRAGDGGVTRPKVLLVGAACQLTDYAAEIESAGAWVVDDDLCTSSRAFAIKEIRCDEPIETLARMYLSRRPCPSKHCRGFDPAEELLDRARESGADGVVFLLTKFCEPWAFDYPAERERLEGAGIPSILIEIEQHQTPAAQFETRVAAFVETLRAGSKTEAL